MHRIPLLASLVIAACCASQAQAQIKLPVFDESKGSLKEITYKETTDAKDFQHGKLVRITMKDGSQKDGVLVRTDAAKNMVYVRTKAGDLPVAVSANDIKSYAKGTIRTVSTDSDVVRPEIEMLVIYNGAKKTVTFRAPTLSPTELKQLEEIQAAESEYDRLERLARIDDQAITDDAASRSENRKTREMLNMLLLDQVELNGYLNTPEGRTFYWPRWTGYGYSSPYGYGYGFGYGGGYGMAGAASAQIGNVRAAYQPPPVTPYTPVVSREALTKARQAYETAVSHGVYQNGQLVAVVVDSK
ncbi:MAG TPA: hypothetical protein VFE62_01225 [Gemmataceae bacterium]|nr:hypothetical protein [Gemmataceae bacterium]